MRQRLIIPLFSDGKIGTQQGEGSFLRSLNSDETISQPSGFRASVLVPTPFHELLRYCCNWYPQPWCPKWIPLSSPNYPPGLSTPARSTCFSLQGSCSWKSREENCFHKSLFPRLRKNGGHQGRPWLGGAHCRAILDSSLQKSKSSVERAGPRAGPLAPCPPSGEEKLLRLAVQDLSGRRHWGRGSKLSASGGQTIM